jgi:hypothetical protein
LHAGTYETHVTELGQQVGVTLDCWDMTTLGGTTIHVLASTLSALDQSDQALYWMGSHPVNIHRTPISCDDEPLGLVYVTHVYGPDPMQLGACHLSHRSIIRPAEYRDSIVLVCRHRPPSLPL